MTTGFQLPPVSDAAEFDLVPEGLYLFRLTSIENAGLGMAFDDKPPKERAKWIFEVTQVIAVDDEEAAEEFIGKDFWAWTTISMNLRSTMYAWSCALLGRELPEGEQPDIDELIGKDVRANVEHYKKQNNTTGHRISSLLKYSGKKKKPSNVPPPADPEGFEDDDDSDDEF